jgi:hypothetical protein
MRINIINPKRVKRCKVCGHRWCGTDLKLIELYGPDYVALGHGVERVTFGSKECRDQ